MKKNNIEEMSHIIEEYCNTQTMCHSCMFGEECPLTHREESDYEEKLKEGVERLHKNGASIKELTEEVVREVEEDMVNHPPHYNREGAMETIDEMVLLFGKAEVMAYCKLNAWKYRARAMFKNGEEDMKKSDWYLAKYKELKCGETNES